MDLDSVLRSVQLQYQDKAKSDINACLSSFKDLHPQSDSFTFADGVSRRVVALSGTIPVLYSGTTYNIPVCVYLLDSHPYHPPIAYVRPTHDMMIKPGKHVDTQGRVYLPYLSEWSHPKCSLEALVQIMAMVFQDACPVFARSSQTPYPSAGGGMPQPARPASGSFSFGQPKPTSYPSQPPYPPSSSATPYPMASGNPPYPYSSQASATSTSSSSGTIQPEHIRASIQTAVRDAVKARVADDLGTSFAELDSVRRTKEELERGQAQLKTMLGELETEQAELDSAVLLFKDKKAQLEAALASAVPADALRIDDAIDTSSVLHRQLFTAFVEDNAIEDAIYYLGQGLAKGRLDLDAYLREVRKLSRQQFALRATMIKCRQKAKLPV